MVERTEYLKKLTLWKDEQVIKVVTGIRRCGKSTLLMQYQEHLRSVGIEDRQIVSLNFEELENYTGVPLDAFVNYSISDGSRGDMALIMSGCSKPMDRIAECTRVADKARALFENTNDEDVDSELEMLDFMSNRKTSNITAKTRGKTGKNISFDVGNFDDDGIF